MGSKHLGQRRRIGVWKMAASWTIQQTSPFIASFAAGIPLDRMQTQNAPRRNDLEAGGRDDLILCRSSGQRDL